MPFHIKTPKTLENKGFRRYYLARQKGFEPPALPSGRTIEQLSYMFTDVQKKASNHQAFFHIPNRFLFTEVHRCR